MGDILCLYDQLWSDFRYLNIGSIFSGLFLPRNLRTKGLKPGIQKTHAECQMTLKFSD